MMATALPIPSCSDNRYNSLSPLFAMASAGGRLFRQGSDALAQAIDLSLTVVFLLTDLVLAASLAATAAGFALAPPH